jgi:hypothetical protein
MKNTRFTSILSLIACALTIGSLASTQSALAQTSTPVAVVDIPFAFHTPNQTLPAGKYVLDRESASLLRLKGTGSTGGFVIIHDAIKNQAPSRGVAVFDRYGDTYYLRQVWTAGNSTGLECAKGKAEKESMQAKNMPAPSTVELALNSVPQY